MRASCHVDNACVEVNLASALVAGSCSRSDDLFDFAFQQLKVVFRVWVSTIEFFLVRHLAVVIKLTHGVVVDAYSDTHAWQGSRVGQPTVVAKHRSLRSRPGWERLIIEQGEHSFLTQEHFNDFVSLLVGQTSLILKLSSSLLSTSI